MRAVVMAHNFADLGETVQTLAGGWRSHRVHLPVSPRSLRLGVVILLMTESPGGFPVLHWFSHPAATFSNGPFVELFSVAHLQ